MKQSTIRMITSFDNGCNAACFVSHYLVVMYWTNQQGKEGNAEIPLSFMKFPHKNFPND